MGTSLRAKQSAIATLEPAKKIVFFALVGVAAQLNSIAHQQVYSALVRVEAHVSSIAHQQVYLLYDTPHFEVGKPMRLLDRILGRKTNAKTEDKVLPSFWEDDYCQVELVPKKNTDHILQSIRQINAFTEKTRTENGFTEIFAREGLPFSTLNAALRIDDFEQLIAGKGFEKAKQIRYDGYTIINCSGTTSNALSLPCFSFFYDCKEGLIHNIWISAAPIARTDDFDKIAAALYALGTAYDLVLTDWNKLELIDLADRRQIESYLRGYRK